MKRKIVVYSYNGIILNNTRKQTLMHATRWINLKIVMVSEKGPSSHWPQKVYTIWFRFQKILENACCCLWIVGKGFRKDWGKDYKGTQGTQGIFWLCWTRSLSCLWWSFLRYIHIMKHNTFYTLYTCSLFHVNHTSIKLLRTKRSPKKSIFIIPLGKWLLPIILVVPYPSPHNSGGWAPPQCQQKLESNVVHLHFLHEECWLGHRSPILDLSFVSAGISACVVMAIMLAAQGGRGIHKSLDYLLWQGPWPQEIQTSEVPENFCTHSTQPKTHRHLQMFPLEDTSPLIGQSSPLYYLSVSIRICPVGFPVNDTCLWDSGHQGQAPVQVQEIEIP